MVFPVDKQQGCAYLPVDIPQEGLAMSGTGNPESHTEVLQGTLDLMVLKTLETMGPQHGYGIARRIEQISGDVLHMNQGTLYPALLRLEQSGWVSSKWGVSDNNRRAKYYAITKSGLKQLAAETKNWERVAGIIGCLLQPAEGA
jgi:PadR family transcriptional regulator, regulatory protein PadR